jgi:hypothetical protein
VQGGRVFVETREEWEYWWQKVQDGSMTLPPKKVVYIIQYNLVRANDTWKVDKLDEAQ